LTQQTLGSPRIMQLSIHVTKCFRCPFEDVRPPPNAAAEQKRRARATWNAPIIQVHRFSDP
jgi:hypothetical protein